MPDDELFLECPVESFYVRIHLWCVGVNEVMGYAVVHTIGVEVLKKLRSVVRLHAGYFNINLL